MGPTYTTTVDLSGSANDVSVASVSGATSQVTAVSFLTGPQGADSTVPGPPGQDGADGVSDHTLLTNRGTNTHAQIDIALTRLANTSGTNTGDQDLSSYATSTEVSTGLATKANTTHSHVITDTTGLQTALDGKQASGDYATNTNLALKSNIADIVDNLTSISASTPLSANQGRVLKGLIDTINTALSSDDTTLDELQEIVEYIKLNRADLDSLSIASIAGLQTTLDGKSDTTHTHTKADVGLGNVDNTSDVSKPVSTAQAAADALKVSKTGDAMTGTLDVANSFGSQSVVLSGTSPDRPLQVTATHAGQVRAFINNLNTSGDAQFTVASNGATKWSAGFEASSGDFVVANGFDLDSSRIFSVKTNKSVSINGADYITGTGFPNGTVSAPVGSIYIDKAITNGASSWIKKSGTGNTGWQVLEGDTGWRNVTALFANFEAVNANDYGIHWKRIGNRCYVKAKCQVKDAANTSYTLPADMASHLNSGIFRFQVLGSSSSIVDMNIASTTVYPVNGGAAVGQRGWINSFYDAAASSAWPTTLPGAAV